MRYSGQFCFNYLWAYKTANFAPQDLFWSCAYIQKNISIILFAIYMYFSIPTWTYISTTFFSVAQNIYIHMDVFWYRPFV